MLAFWRVADIQIHAKTPTPQPVIEATASTGADEASKIAAMFANTDEQWKTTQEKMSTLVQSISAVVLIRYYVLSIFFCL